MAINEPAMPTIFGGCRYDVLHLSKNTIAHTIMNTLFVLAPIIFKGTGRVVEAGTYVR